MSGYCSGCGNTQCICNLISFEKILGIICPFCGESDFDLVGLKNHLQKYCIIYSEMPTVEEDLAQRRLVNIEARNKRRSD